MTDSPLQPLGLSTRFKTRVHRLQIAQRTIDLLAPVDPDALLNDPEVEKRYKADNYMPYWPILWPSGLMLAEKILSEESPATIPPGNASLGKPRGRCIDLGCGLGITGIAAALAGWHVTFTDYDREAVQFAAANAHRNGVPAYLVRAVEMDWRNPLPETFDWIVASDVLYERRLHPLLLSAIDKLLSPSGSAWISDPQRTSAEDFPLAAVAAGFRIETERLSPLAALPQSPPGDLFVLRRSKK